VNFRNKNGISGTYRNFRNKNRISRISKEKKKNSSLVGLGLKVLVKYYADFKTKHFDVLCLIARFQLVTKKSIE
jgi:hypothetical protein